MCLRHAYPCAIEGCDKHGVAGGYCQVHAKDHALDSYNKLRISQLIPCKVDGCTIQTVADGYCAEHAQQYSPDAYAKFRLRTNKRIKHRRNNDYAYRLENNIRNRIRDELKRVGKSDTGKVNKYLGCTVTQLRKYFELNHFQEEGNEWMCWKNRGESGVLSINLGN